MPYPNPDRMRNVDSFHTAHHDDETAENVIDNVQGNLLTQDQLFESEGGYMGLALNAGIVAAGFGALLFYKPTLWHYLRMGQLRANEWFLLAGTGYVTY